MPVGYWCPVLHAHLPYVRHPEYPQFLEEDWFFEALTETYIPLVSVLDGLLADGVEYRLTMTLSPPLVSMLHRRPARLALPPPPRPPGRALGKGDRADKARGPPVPRTSRGSTSTSSAGCDRSSARPTTPTSSARSASTATRASSRSSRAGPPTASCPSWTRFRRRCGPRCTWPPSTTAVTSVVTPRGSGCPSAATSRATSGSCGRWACATASWSRTGSPTRTPGRARACTLPSSPPGASSSSVATWSRRGRSGARSRATRVTWTTGSSTRTWAGSCRSTTSSRTSATACAATSGSSTTG